MVLEKTFTEQEVQARKDVLLLPEGLYKANHLLLEGRESEQGIYDIANLQCIGSNVLVWLKDPVTSEEAQRLTASEILEREWAGYIIE